MQCKWLQLFHKELFPFLCKYFFFIQLDQNLEGTTKLSSVGYNCFYQQRLKTHEKNFSLWEAEMWTSKESSFSIKIHSLIKWRVEQGFFITIIYRPFCQETLMYSLLRNFVSAKKNINLPKNPSQPFLKLHKYLFQIIFLL